jgi:3-isopropylmalate/(R)-2-methylmalate dehydratase small subunit
MKPFSLVSGYVVPLYQKDIDTDLIIPAQYMTSVSKGGYGTHLFTRLRSQDSTFPLNNPTFRDAPILVAGANFGCGSSREHAVWALLEWGIKVIIAESFADIFNSNSAKNGLLLVTLPSERVQEIHSRAQINSPLTMAVNLEALTISLDDKTTISFTYDPFRRDCLLQGLDDFDYVLKYRSQARHHFQSRESHRFFAPPSSILKETKP